MLKIIGFIMAIAAIIAITVGFIIQCSDSGGIIGFMEDYSRWRKRIKNERKREKEDND